MLKGLDHTARNASSRVTEAGCSRDASTAFAQAEAGSQSRSL